MVTEFLYKHLYTKQSLDSAPATDVLTMLAHTDFYTHTINQLKTLNPLLNLTNKYHQFSIQYRTKMFVTQTHDYEFYTGNVMTTRKKIDIIFFLSARPLNKKINDLT